MDRPYIAENDAARSRIVTLLDRLSDNDLSRPISSDWTVGVGLMHLAFWDRQWLSKFEEWERTGTVELPPLREFYNELNDAMRLWWHSIAPVQIRHEAIAAAETIDSKLANLPEPLVAAILAVRPRTLVRATHRTEHLDEIEHALAT